MGKKPDAIYDEITQHRERMSRERSHLQERLRSDVSGVKSRISERTPDAASDIGQRVAQHPLSYIAGGFGSGVVLGMLAPGIGMPSRGGSPGNGHQSQASGNGASGSGLTGALAGTFMEAFEDAVRPMMRDVMAGFKGDDRPPEQRDAAQRQS